MLEPFIFCIFGCTSRRDYKIGEQGKKNVEAFYFSCFFWAQIFGVTIKLGGNKC